MVIRKPLPPTSAVVWDFDDTLADSMPARAKALAQVFLQAGVEDLDPRSFLHNLPQNTFEASLACLADNLGISTDLFSCYKSIYWTKEPGSLRLYPGVQVVLDHMKNRGVQLALVTQKERTFEVEGVRAGASTELEDLRISDYFPVVIGFGDVKETKPHPEGILNALESLGVPLRQAVMVGDSVTDIQAAKAAGCWSCLATWGVPDGPDRARRSTPDFVAETPGDVIGVHLQMNAFQKQ